MNELVLTAAITGAELTKKENPNLPLSPAEQARAAVDCVKAGAAVIHLHVRDDAGKPSQELEHFRRTVDAIRAACADAKIEVPILQFSTGGAVGEPMERRIAPLSLRPDMASFNLGTMNFGRDIFVNTRPDMRSLAEAFVKYKVTPEFEVYDLGHIDELHSLIQEGLVHAPYHVQFVLGVPGGARPYPGKDETDATRLRFLISQLPPGSTWGVAGVGRYERSLAHLSIALGGQVRVGLEDNIYFSKGVLAESNAQLVADIARHARSAGRDAATPSAARKILEL